MSRGERLGEDTLDDESRIVLWKWWLWTLELESLGMPNSWVRARVLRYVRYSAVFVSFVTCCLRYSSLLAVFCTSGILLLTPV